MVCQSVQGLTEQLNETLSESWDENKQTNLSTPKDLISLGAPSSPSPGSRRQPGRPAALPLLPHRYCVLHQSIDSDYFFFS